MTNNKLYNGKSERKKERKKNPKKLNVNGLSGTIYIYCQLAVTLWTWTKSIGFYGEIPFMKYEIIIENVWHCGAYVKNEDDNIDQKTVLFGVTALFFKRAYKSSWTSTFYLSVHLSEHIVYISILKHCLIALGLFFHLLLKWFILLENNTATIFFYCSLWRAQHYKIIYILHTSYTLCMNIEHYWKVKFLCCFFALYNVENSIA